MEFGLIGLISSASLLNETAGVCVKGQRAIINFVKSIV